MQLIASRVGRRLWGCPVTGHWLGPDACRRKGWARLSAGDARHGRRDNGLEAAEYAAAGDVDPRVGEHLLDVLALDGIAAYLPPSTDLHPVNRSSTLPGRPTDRLYVDRTHLATARDYLDRLAEEPDGSGGTPRHE